VAENTAAIELAGIGVRFSIPNERIRSFKEYVLRRLSGRIGHRELWALADVSLAVATGETFGVVGRNGAGKSTLLKVVSRVLRPTTGRVILRGRTAALLELGAGFHFDLTGRENVFLNAALLGHARGLVARHFDEIVAFAELAEFIDLPVRSYSSGMLARLGFAVATQFRPDLLIVDEILAVGDTGFQDKCLRRLEGFRRQGTTTLIVSHELEHLEAHCDRVAWLEHGRIVALDAPARVVPRYREAMLAASPA
jgi:ABC-2 type transport system ATP-binding protein/lipopolysaccharide transport system ATP-binding protein